MSQHNLAQQRRRRELRRRRKKEADFYDVQAPKGLWNAFAWVCTHDWERSAKGRKRYQVVQRELTKGGKEF